MTDHPPTPLRPLTPFCPAWLVLQVTWVAMIIAVLFFEMNLGAALWTGLLAGKGGLAGGLAASTPACLLCMVAGLLAGRGPSSSSSPQLQRAWWRGWQPSRGC